jgi:membrane protease YdiL (CAAX protease family)
MPQWPGPVLVLGGGALAITALVAEAMAASGSLGVANRAALAWLAVIGGAAFTAGLVYAAVRQLRVRRYLSPERYRGPSVFVLIALVLVIAAVLTLPFGADALVLVLGEGEMSFLGALVLLTSTQVALLVVSWLLVFRPNALAGLPWPPGPNPVRAIRSGVGWGVVASLGASVISYGVLTLFEALGIDTAPEVADQALALIDPWLAVLAVAILAPIAEEIFFRGVVFNALLREGSRRWAYLGSSALFAAIHLSLVAVLPIFLIGLAMAWVYDRAGNLLAPIAMHLTVNGLAVLIALAVRFELVPVPV